MFTQHVGLVILNAMLCASSCLLGASIPDLDDPQGQVTRIEYFFDEDPGVGNGVPFDFNADAEGRIQLNLDLPLDGLEAGKHQLFIRAQNARNEWSIDSKHTFFLTPFATQSPPIIEKGEYFVGEDPGFGKGLPVLPIDQTGGPVSFSVQSPPMLAGHHTLQFRAQDSFGNWSMPVKNSFLLLPDIRATSVEWSLLEGEEVVASGTEVVQPPASRFSGTLMTPLVGDETILQRSLQAQARLVLEERIPTVTQSFTLELPTLVEPLRMIMPPTSQTLNAGDALTLSVIVAGGGELTYQWFHNDQPIPNAMGATLEIGKVSVADAGSYHVQIESPIGNLQSQTAVLTVNDPNPPVGEVVYHPADTNQDGRIVIGEVTSYGSAWKRGDTWPTEPNPIPIGYLTRAGALWKGGEVYEKDVNVAQAPLWWVNPAPAVRALSVYAPSVSQNKVVRKVEQSSVQIDVQPAFPTQVYAVEESIPVGYIAVGISHGGVFDKKSHQVRWGPFLDQQPRSLTYQIVAEQGVSDDPIFKGMASFDGLSVFIRDSVDSKSFETSEPSLGIRIGEGGAAQISIQGELNGDYVIESSERLQDAVWVEIGSVPSGSNSWEQETDLQHARQFYRIRKIPAATR